MQSEIKENYNKVIASLPKNVQLVVVSKTHSAEIIQEVYDLNHRIFGENKVQELVEKSEVLPKDIQWHLIGHLQTNKVKFIAPFIDTVESVDSEKLLEEINNQAARNNRKIKVLLQVKIAEEDSKFGLEIAEAEDLYNKYLTGNFPNIIIKGLMGMATFTEDDTHVRKEFTLLKQYFDTISTENQLDTLSMGMSGDYKTAVECGSNSVRIGSAIFGHRNYNL